jgi:hypothetical protein
MPTGVPKLRIKSRPPRAEKGRRSLLGSFRQKKFRSCKINGLGAPFGPRPGPVKACREARLGASGSDFRLRKRQLMLSNASSDGSSASVLLGKPGGSSYSAALAPGVMPAGARDDGKGSHA